MIGACASIAFVFVSIPSLTTCVDWCLIRPGLLLADDSDEDEWLRLHVRGYRTPASVLRGNMLAESR